ncbi:MAG: redoxin domain-containing protein [Candidatus Omnitrophota bacterium]|nr:redoxin domain-containing protein [Candidatus Omnitrophota bacterium]
MVRLLYVFVLFVLMGCASWPPLLQEKIFPPSAPHIIVDDFSLLDQDGDFHQLSYYSDQKAIVLITQGNGCPIIRHQIGYLNQLKEQYEPLGVVFLMLNANPQDDRQAIVKEAQEYGIQIPILKDDAQIVASQLSLTRTAEAIVIDPRNGSIVYRGAITDRMDYESQKNTDEHHYLRDQLDAILANKPVLLAQTPVKGCLIQIGDKDTARSTNYVQDVAPILIEKCLLCHSPGAGAPWSMENYIKVRGWGPMIGEVVRTKRMPPWHADPQYGSFNDDLSLSPHQVHTLVRWVEQGMARGEGEDPLLKAPRPSKEFWPSGKPDLVYSIPVQDIPATGVLPYRIIEMTQPLQEDVWVKAVDLRPENKQVVHHANVTASSPQGLAQEDFPSRTGLQVEGVGQVIASYAPGYRPFVLPPDTGLFIPKGSRLTFWIHYVTTGKPEKDAVLLGLYLHRTPPPKPYIVDQISNKNFRIPPGDKHYKVRGEYRFAKDALLYILVPHMHYRGRSMRFTAKYPNGKTEILLSVPNYKFPWQRRYIFQEPKKIPAGTTMMAEGIYDNSTQNPLNPNPSQEVTFGQQSDDEMFSGFLGYTWEERR